LTGGPDPVAEKEQNRKTLEVLTPPGRGTRVNVFASSEGGAEELLGGEEQRGTEKKGGGNHRTKPVNRPIREDP